MTPYEHLKSVPEATRKALIKMGVLSALTERNMAIFECFCCCCEKNMPRMDARATTASEFGISEESVGLIVSKMK